MSSSLTDACTPFKIKYDSCFNAWFEGYLEPVVKATSDESRKALQKAKAEEYERNCGAMWTDYRDCVQRAVADKGLTQLLEDARRENPMQNPPSPPNKS